MTLSSRQDLADFALRQLGGGIVNIEVTPNQLEDCIDLTLRYYREYHFDGIERDYLARKITATYFTVANSAGFNVGDNITASGGGTANITKIVGNTITVSIIVKPMFAVGQTVTNGTVTQAISTLSAGDIDNRYIPADDMIYGVIKVLNLSTSILGSSSNTLFNVQYQMMMQEIRQLTSSGGASYYYSVMQYLSELDFQLRKERDFRFNRRMNKIFLDINWESEVKVDDYVVVEVYRYVDEETYTQVFDDLWVRSYMTAQVKRVWASGLKKYEKVEMPGGVVFTGQTLYDEAIKEIEKLQQEALSGSAPLNFIVG